MSCYTTPEQVRESTGVQQADFKLDSGLALEQVLDRWCEYVKGEIDDHAGVDFLDEVDGDMAEVHATIRGVSERALSRWVQQVRSHRDSALIRLDDWRVGIDLVDEVLPRHMRDTIDRHMRTRARGRWPHGFGAFVAHGGRK